MTGRDRRHGQVNLLQNFVTQGVDGMVYAATDAKVLSDVTEQALQQSIPVVNIDSGTDPQPKDVPVFATDNVAAAEQVPELMADATRPQGRRHRVHPVPARHRRPTSSARRASRRGSSSTRSSSSSPSSPARATTTRALQVTEDILTANPDLKGDLRRQRAGRARRGRGRPSGAQDRQGDDRRLGRLAGRDHRACADGVIDSLVVQNPFRMGYDGVNAVVKQSATARSRRAPTRA